MWVGYQIPPSDPGVRLPSHRAPLNIGDALQLVVDTVQNSSLRINFDASGREKKKEQKKNKKGNKYKKKEKRIENTRII